MCWQNEQRDLDELAVFFQISGHNQTPARHAANLVASFGQVRFVHLVGLHQLQKAVGRLLPPALSDVPITSARNTLAASKEGSVTGI